MSDFTKESGFYKGRPVMMWRHKSGETFVDEASKIAIDELRHCSQCGAETYIDGISPEGNLLPYCIEHHPLRSLTTNEAAEIADCSQKGILQAIARGKLRAFKHGRDYVIALGDLQEWLQSPRKIGRPQN